MAAHLRRFEWYNLKWEGVTKQSNAVTSNEKTSNGIKIQEVKK